MERQIYIEKRPLYEYPDDEALYAPSQEYPEYPYKGRLSAKENEVYDMVRQSLYGLGLDRERFGTPEWNPFGEYISPGGKVVIKPNMVKHYDETKMYECAVTHPSVVRTVIDYCVIAKAGHIIVGDAPIQGADMEKIRRDCGYDRIVEFYQKEGVSIEFCDFRDLIVKTVNGSIVKVRENGPECPDYTTVHLGKKSRHFEEGKNPVYETCGYPLEKINHLHKGGRHDYVVASKVLEADVILNLPKPKTHRFAGITGAQKNFVGCCSDKESLPHFKAGPPQRGGDESNRDTLAIRQYSKFSKKYLQACREEKFKLAFFYRALRGIFRRLKSKNDFLDGAWHGNDTIWRTIMDLNEIMLYADKNGEMRWGEPQRRILTVGDMIIAGEKEGPLDPSPKKLGIIMVSRNCAVFDYVFCKLAGFDERLLPAVYHTIRNEKLFSGKRENIKIGSNDIRFQDNIEEFQPLEETMFEPHSFWKDVL